MTKHEVASIVDNALKPYKFRWSVAPSDVRREGRSWYVLVPTEKPGHNSYKYYFKLADIEESSIQDKHDLNVLFVPAKED